MQDNFSPRYVCCASTETDRIANRLCEGSMSVVIGDFGVGKTHVLQRVADIKRSPYFDFASIDRDAHISLTNLLHIIMHDPPRAKSFYKLLENVLQPDSLKFVIYYSFKEAIPEWAIKTEIDSLPMSRWTDSIKRRLYLAALCLITFPWEVFVVENLDFGYNTGQMQFVMDCLNAMRKTKPGVKIVTSAYSPEFLSLFSSDAWFILLKASPSKRYLATAKDLNMVEPSAQYAFNPHAWKEITKRFAKEEK